MPVSFLDRFKSVIRGKMSPEMRQVGSATRSILGNFYQGLTQGQPSQPSNPMGGNPYDAQQSSLFDWARNAGINRNILPQMPGQVNTIDWTSGPLAQAQRAQQPANYGQQINMPAQPFGPGTPAPVAPTPLANPMGGGSPRLDQATASIMPYGMASVSPMAGNRGLMAEQARMFQVRQEADQWMQQYNNRQQYLDARFAARGMNQRLPTEGNLNATMAGSQYAQQQFDALGGNAAGINPALAAASNQRTDFASMPGGANMLARFGNTGAMNPMGQPANTYDMQVGGYGSPVQYNPMRNPQEVIGEMRDKAVQGFDDRNYKGPYVTSEGALTNRQTFLRDRAAQTADPAERARLLEEANQVSEGMKQKMQDYKAIQARNREKNGGTPDFIMRRRTRALDRQREWMRKQGINPMSPEAAAFAPETFERTQDVRQGRRPANPMDGWFNASTTRTPDNIARGTELASDLAFGKTDAEGNVVKPPRPVFASMGFETADQMTLDSVSSKLAEQSSQGVEWSDEDLKDIYTFAMSRRVVEGEDAFQTKEPTDWDYAANQMSGVNVTASRNMLIEMQNLGENPSPDKLREWASSFRRRVKNVHGEFDPNRWETPVM